MLHSRVIKTKGNSRSVQVYYYRNGRRVIVKHIGSGTTDDEIASLEQMARIFLLQIMRINLSSFEKTSPEKMQSCLAIVCTLVFTTLFSMMSLGLFSTLLVIR